MIAERADRFDSFEFVKDVSLTLASANSEYEVYQLITMKVVAHLGIRRCRIYLLSEDGLSLFQVARHCSSSKTDNLLRDTPFTYVGDDVIGACALSGVSYLVADMRLLGERMDDRGAGEAKLAVPILLDEDVHAVIDCEHPFPGFFTTEHQRSLECIASVIAAILKIPGPPRPEASNSKSSNSTSLRPATVVSLADYRDR